VSQPYNPRSVIRQTPNALLSQFFEQFPDFADVDWSGLTETEIGPVFERWQDLPEQARNKIDTVFRKVHALADSIGTLVLIEAARDRSLEIAAKLGAKQSAYERAIWCYLEHPEIFEDARTLAHIDSLARNSWEKRKGLPKQQVKVTDDLCKTLGEKVSAHYRGKEGRGHLCVVEHRRRENDLDWFFAYPSDYPDEHQGYHEDGKFIRQTWRPAFEVVFVYDHAGGTLELFAKGGKKQRAELSGVFTLGVFGVADESEPYQRDNFDLALFKNPDIKFPTKPADRITSVRVIGLRIQIHRKPGGRLMFEVDARQKNVSVYDLIAVALNERKARLADATVLSVTMQAIFEKPKGKPKNVSFKLSAGSVCDLGDTPEELLLRSYLRTWKIESDA
jgi:hypothetical protein